MEDAAIVDLYWQRDQQAIPETDRKYGRYCHTIAYNICTSHEDAEECVNDTWLRAWNLMPDKRPTILSTFLGTISRNFALDRYRSRTRQKRGGGETALALEELADCVPGPGDPEEELETKELGRALQRFVRRLPPRERDVFVSRYYFLAPLEELSRKTGFSESKLKSMLFRTRKKLNRFLQEEGYR